MPSSRTSTRRSRSTRGAPPAPTTYSRGSASRRSPPRPPRGYLFVYERDILQHFADLHAYREGTLDADSAKRLMERLTRGAPQAWPNVRRWTGPRFIYHDNTLEESVIGSRGDETDRVLASARRGSGTLYDACSFLEARPRKRLLYPRRPTNEVRAAILVSGGIAPGINAVIDGIVQRHHQYCGPKSKPKVWGLRNGLLAFDDMANEREELMPKVTARAAIDGGSLIGTSRDDCLLDPATRTERLKSIVGDLKSHGIDILYVIGGDGSMKAAHAIRRVAEAAKYELSIVTIPKTMDNDVLWVWQSFGFLSAVQSAREFVDHLHREVSSNPRICVLQLFGSDSGFVVSHAVLASAPEHCDLALIPEVPFSLVDISRHLKRRIRESKRSIPHALIVMAETAIPTDARECLGDATATAHADLYRRTAERAALTEAQKNAVRQYFANNCTVAGQTSDELRRAGMKLVKAGIEVFLPEIDIDGIADEPNWSRLRIFSSEPRHLLRSSAPTTADFIMAQRLGILAVDNAMAGYTDFMISNWLTEFVLVPLDLVVLGRKRVPPGGIFWKSVLAKTGQDANLNESKQPDALKAPPAGPDPAPPSEIRAE